MLPIICESVVSIAVGCPVVRSELQKPLDSYQEDDLNMLKDKWSEALAKRKEYLDRQLKNILEKPLKTEAENEREQLLVDQCVFLTEEQEYVMVPAPGSGVPGAPADNEPPEGMEQVGNCAEFLAFSIWTFAKLNIDISWNIKNG